MLRCDLKAASHRMGLQFPGWGSLDRPHHMLGSLLTPCSKQAGSSEEVERLQDEVQRLRGEVGSLSEENARLAEELENTQAEVGARGEGGRCRGEVCDG